MDERLEGRVGIVTGAASGLGKAIAVGFARAGADVVIADIDTHAAEETAREMNADGLSAYAVHCDVTKPSSVKAMVRKSVARFGKVDLLCNNTGACLEAKLKIRLVELTDAQWDQTFDLGLKSIHNCCREVVPEMIKAGGGGIINISSVAGDRPAFSAAFSAMKAGVIAITKSIAIQYADDNIRCNCICPGAFRTTGGLAAGKKGLFAGMNARRVRLIQRFGEAEDIAPVAVFFASEDSRYITGQSLDVDGGMLSLVENIPPRSPEFHKEK